MIIEFSLKSVFGLSKDLFERRREELFNEDGTLRNLQEEYKGWT